MAVRAGATSWLGLARRVFETQPSHDYTIQLLRSLVVSAVALIVDFGTLIVLKQKFGIYYLLAATISFCLGILVNYALSVKWVFAYRQLTSRTHEFIVFVIITAAGLLFNLLIIAGMVELLKVDYRVGKAVSTIIVFFWNFLARKKILY